LPAEESGAMVPMAQRPRDRAGGGNAMSDRMLVYEGVIVGWIRAIRNGYLATADHDHRLMATCRDYLGCIAWLMTEHARAQA
jgi:hypothetical protein